MWSQLPLFEESAEDKHNRQIQTLEEKYDKLRKSQHARITGLQKEIKDLKSDLDLLKSYICKGNLL